MAFYFSNGSLFISRLYTNLLSLFGMLGVFILLTFCIVIQLESLESVWNVGTKYIVVNGDFM